MKKIFTMVLAFTLVVCSLFGCSKMPKHFTGEWKFAELTQLELVSGLTANEMEAVQERYNASSKEGIESNAKAEMLDAGIYDNYYIKFTKKFTYTYDPIFEREATWKFYQTGENNGFISFYTELNVEDGNPDPIICPEISYDADNDVLYIVECVHPFMATIKLTR